MPDPKKLGKKAAIQASVSRAEYELQKQLLGLEKDYARSLKQRELYNRLNRGSAKPEPRQIEATEANLAAGKALQAFYEEMNVPMENRNVVLGGQEGVVPSDDRAAAGNVTPTARTASKVMKKAKGALR